jgi:lysine-N-methylase
MANNKTALALDYYSQFSCIGGACEDSCCIGWRVDIDKRTYKKYKENQHKVLAPLFKSAVKRNDSSSTPDCYGVISLDPEGKCSFLDQDKLCKIQKTMGPEALSPVCTNYPRTAYRLGEQFEYSLGLSCPEVARLVLLKREPLQFIEVSRMQSLEGSGSLIRQNWERGEDSPAKLPLIYDLRALIIGILQHREIHIDARLMMLGLLLEATDKSVGAGFEKLEENLPGVLAEYAGMLAHAGIIQTELDKVEPDYSLKLSVLGDIVSALMPKIIKGRFRECLEEAVDGLSFKTENPKSDSDIVAHLREVNASICVPFFEANPNILENYLVDYVFRTVFPLKYKSLLLHFREMVCNYLILKFLLLGMAAFHKKINDDLVVKLFQSFNRVSAHNSSYMATIISSLEARNLGDFRSLIVLLLDGVEPDSANPFPK